MSGRQDEPNLGETGAPVGSKPRISEDDAIELCNPGAHGGAGSPGAPRPNAPRNQDSSDGPSTSRPKNREVEHEMVKNRHQEHVPPKPATQP